MKTKLLIAPLICLVIVTSHEDALGRGFGGGGGRGGGGGISRGGGGGGFSRPSGGGGGARPNIGGGNFGGAGRPNMGGGMSRPSPGGAGRPNLGGAGGGRPGGGNPIAGGGNRPNLGGGNRPSLGGGERPNLGGGNRPGIGEGNRPGIGEGNRPGLGGGTRPGTGGTLPGLGGGNRPGIGEGNRPGIGEGNRPGIGNGNRPGIGQGNRPGFGDGNRPGFGDGNRPGNRPGGGGSGERNPIINNRPGGGNNIGNNVHFGNNNFNNFNNNHNNFIVGGGNNWHNDWHHGYWGGGNWGAAAAGWGLGYGAGYRRGYWNGYANSGWYRPWYGAAAAWGLGAWALGSVYYDSGYAMYSNPYYVSNVGYYDYSQPLQVVAQPQTVAVAQDGSAPVTPAQPPPEVQASLTHLDVARDAFMAGDYAKAGAELDLAIKDQPNDAALHEFRALVYFAIRDYTKAAGTLYAVLSAGPGWDWTTMSSLYPGVEVYTEQLRALEQSVKQKPDGADGHFVLAYHYITGTHNEAAVRQLQEVARLQPGDQLTIQLIKGLGGEVPSKPGTAAPPTVDPAVGGVEPPQPPDIDPAKIIGNWTAKRPDGTTFTLNLTPDKKFTWAFERGGKKQSFGGTYSVEGAVLVLERDDKASMPGVVTMGATGFNFKLFGAPEEDPGLDFKS